MINKNNNKIAELYVVLGIFAIVAILGVNTAYGQVNEKQKELAFNDNGEKKVYTDCNGYKQFTEGQSISKEVVDSNTTAVDQRITSLYNGGILPEN